MGMKATGLEAILVTDSVSANEYIHIQSLDRLFYPKWHTGIRVYSVYK